MELCDYPMHIQRLVRQYESCVHLQSAYAMVEVYQVGSVVLYVY